MPIYSSINQQASWNYNNVENGGTNGGNLHAHQFAALMIKQIAAHYASPLPSPYNVPYWEIWNEPNGATHCQGQKRQTAAGY